MHHVSRMTFSLAVAGCTAALALAVAGTPAQADDFANVFKSRNMTLFVGSAPGGGYDRYTRLLSRHFNRHVPGKPRIVVKNMPGASGLILARHMFHKAAKDGSDVAGVHNTVVTQEIIAGKADYKSTQFNWLGSANQLTTTCIAATNSPIKTYADARKIPFVVGGTGAQSSSTNQVPAFLKSLTGAQLRIIKGYPSTTSVVLAMQRGEVHGLCGIGWDSLKAQAFDLLRDGKIKVVIQIAKEPKAELKGVPFVMDMATSPEDVRVLQFLVARQYMGRPYLVPPGVAADRVKALRAAFDATMADAKYQKDAKKSHIPLSPISGQQVQEHIANLFKTPESVKARAGLATKIQPKDVSEAKLTWITVKGAKIDRVKKRNIYFKDGGKKVKASSRGAKIKVNGKKAKRKAIKAGMTCDIVYLGNGDAAKSITCTK
jgi:tripartite-type tricarboxylate transporter receptor subunit TctC